MHNDLFSIGSVTVHGYGLMIGIGVILAFVISMYRASKRGLSADYLFDLGFSGIISGIIGAKVLYLITEIPSIIEDPSILLNVSEGFVVYGGVIAGIFTPYVYNRIKKKGHFMTYLDIAVPVIPLAQGCGRVGCFLAGCCYGQPTDLPIGIVFPEGSFAPAGIKLFPTQVFSSVFDFAVAALLFVLARRNGKKHNKGLLLALYMMLYAVGRFSIEFFRNDYRGSVGFLSTSQFISIFILIGGIVVLALSNKGYFEPKEEGVVTNE